MSHHEGDSARAGKVGVDWDELAERGPLSSVLDPRDQAEFKNRLIDAIQWAALKQHLPRGGARLLDFGCGTGRFARRIQALGIDYAGVDASAGMIAHAKKSNAEAHFEVFDGKALAFPDGAFDVCISCGVFQYLVGEPECAPLLGEIARVLEPGGLLLLLEQASLSQRKSGTVARSSTEADYRAVLEQRFTVEGSQRVRSSKNPELSSLSFRIMKRLPFAFAWYLQRVAEAAVARYKGMDEAYFRSLDYYDFLVRARAR